MDSMRALDFYQTKPDSIRDKRLRLIWSVLEPHQCNGKHWVREQLIRKHDAWFEPWYVESLLKRLAADGRAKYEHGSGYRRLEWT